MQTTDFALLAIVFLFEFEKVRVFFVGSLIFLHFGEIKLEEDNKRHHEQCEQRVQVKGNRPQEQVETIDGGSFRQRGGYGCRPAGNGGDDADRSRCGVDDIGKLRPGDLVPVGNGAHDGAHGQAVEVIVYEDQGAQTRSGEQSASLRLDGLGRPFSVGSRSP